MKRQKMNHRGYSLIEVLVVIAILMIITFGGFNYIRMVSNTSVKEAATKLTSALNKARTETMSKTQASLRIYKEDSGYYVKFTVNNTEQEPMKVGGTGVRILYTDSAGDVNALTDLTIEFDRDTGGFKPIQTAAGGVKVYCKQITISSGSKTVNLICEKLTGKIRTE